MKKRSTAISHHSGKASRVIIIVLDGLGIGALPDASRFGDEGSNTLGSALSAAPGVSLANLARLGLGCIEGVCRVERTQRPLASFGRMKEASAGKDTITGHHEMTGIVTAVPPPTFPNGFPAEIMQKFERECGVGYLWAKPASGTGIIERLGALHMESRKAIVYTSADSVFQVAAHEDVIPPGELYEICIRARRFLDDYGVGRVIARPFVGKPGAFRRTAGRRDYSIPARGMTLLDNMKEAGLDVIGIGKIGDIFAHRGLTAETRVSSNSEGIEKTINEIRRPGQGLIFTNLVDFDMLYGHRNDAKGFAGALKEFDVRLEEILGALGEKDLLAITADHGCDPGSLSTDHSREYVPLLVYSPALAARDLGTRKSFADLGQTVAQIFNTAPLANGTSFLKDLQ
jgi:phosphopentomutase